MKKRITGKAIFNTIIIAATILIILFFILSENGLKDLLQSSQKISIAWLFIAFGCYFMALLMDCIITYKFIRTKYNHISFYQAIKISLIGSFFSAITPSSTGGQPMQIYAMSKLDINPGFATSILVQKFLIFQITTTLYSVVVLFFKYDSIVAQMENFIAKGFVFLGVFSQLFITVLFLLISFSPKITKVIVNLVSKIIRKLKFIKNPEGKIESLEGQTELFHESNKELLNKPKDMVLHYIGMFFQITFLYAVPFCIYKSLHLSGNTVIDSISTQAIVTMVSSMIPLPGASFAAEYSFAIFFSDFFTEATMKSAILIWRTITYYGVIIVSAPFALITKKSKDLEEDSKPDTTEITEKTEVKTETITTNNN